MKNSFKYHNLNQYCTVLTYTSGPTERKIRYLFMFLFTFLFQPIFSQSMLKYDTPSPGVGSLLRVQSLPVDLHSGRANIAIPLYSIALKIILTIYNCYIIRKATKLIFLLVM